MVQSLTEWLARIERAHPANIALGLERVAAVARRMGLEHGEVTVITVGGTNGKGSCVAVLERLLLARGVRVGAYTSPHLVRYNERVRVDGREVSDQALCAAFGAVEAARGATPLTFFEFGTLAALEIFRRERCEWLLLEVGLGGRLDAVNIVDPDVAVVTSIAVDHTDWLGADRRSIALEKAGIFRPARPVVCGDRDPPSTLPASASVLGAPWYALGVDFDAREQDGRWCWQGCTADGMRIRREVTPPPALLGDNVACALQALALVDALPDAALVQVTLPQITLAGRLQRRRLGKGECVLDVAHNPAGVACLVRRLADAPARGCTRILFGAMRDKDAGAMLATLAPLADAWVFPALSEPRALTAAEVLAALGAAQRSRPVECVPGIAHALVRAERTMVPGDRLVVCGSFHLVGPALEWLDAHA
ncbi:MAG: bifunctional tetrahydrofolate synthase/dihydrofolate synthase [Pseudomonadales bacterium]|nr:bifunctional tetrahydrofolate synthase/dihydrofolate synthase [Pseudomonadales bacterium]MCP5319331.1 bifunctional tetrahydrofolate synthase/dihydrofolate synthase [Pseudomonadales bacterium]MCP5336870.1 bifunctional tetrahydrofolate synthase/dihydrofolate synthase [Pseudomonadales bacterium]